MSAKLGFHWSAEIKLLNALSKLPEISVFGGDDFERIEIDEKVKAALNWLKKK